MKKPTALKIANNKIARIFFYTMNVLGDKALELWLCQLNECLYDLDKDILCQLPTTKVVGL